MGLALYWRINVARTWNAKRAVEFGLVALFGIGLQQAMCLLSYKSPARRHDRFSMAALTPAPSCGETIVRSAAGSKRKQGCAKPVTHDQRIREEQQRFDSECGRQRHAELQQALSH